MKRLTLSDIRKAVELLTKNEITPESCGCVKYNKNGFDLTCQSHTKPLTKEQIRIAKDNLRRMGISPK